MGRFGSRLKQIVVHQLNFGLKPSDGLDYQADEQHLSKDSDGISRKSKDLKNSKPQTRSTLNAAIRSANNWFEVCFQRREHQEVQEAISRIQRKCEEQRAMHSGRKKCYVRRHATLRNCVEESLSSPNKLKLQSMGLRTKSELSYALKKQKAGKAYSTSSVFSSISEESSDSSPETPEKTIKVAIAEPIDGKQLD